MFNLLLVHLVVAETDSVDEDEFFVGFDGDLPGAALGVVGDWEEVFAEEKVGRGGLAVASAAEETQSGFAESCWFLHLLIEVGFYKASQKFR